MQVKLNELNVLPAKTWRWMGVNGGGAEFAFPEPREYKGQPLSQPLPQGVSVRALPENAAGEAEQAFSPEILDFMRANRSSGTYLHASAGSSPEPVVLQYHLDGQNPAVFDQHLIVAEEGSEITVVLRYTGESGILHCGLTALVAKKNASIRLVQVQTLGDSVDHLDNVGAVAMEGGRIEVVQAEMGAARTYAGGKTLLLGPESSFEYSSVYLGDGIRELDFGVVSEHYGAASQSNIRANGVLLGESKKIFRGTIDFKKGASGSLGREAESVMLLSPRVRNRTAPLILCAEEDVDGQHSASIGSIDPQRMYYLQSRGLSELDAKKLLIEAGFSPVTARIPVEAFRREISESLQERLKKIESL